MSPTTTPRAKINLQPGRTHGYSAYVLVRLGKLKINALVDSGNTFANVISPQTMTALGIKASQLEPIPQLSVGTAVQQQYRPYGPSVEALSGPEARRIEGRSRCVLPVQLEPRLPAGALVLLQPTARSLLGDNTVLQEVRADGSLAVLVDNLECGDVDLEPGALVGSVQEVTTTQTTIHADNSLPPEASTHAEFDALPQDKKIKWLVIQFRLDEAPELQRDPRLRKEVIRTLLQFSDVISIGGYGKTNLITQPINVNPGTAPIKMKHRPLNSVMEESLRQQIDRWLEQRVVQEADSPWSFPLVPVPKKNNNKEVCWAVDYRKLNAVTKKDAFPLPNIADNLSRLAGSHVFSALDGAGAFHAVPVRCADRENTAFSSPFGQYQFVRMPFGLANAPATYSRLVARALRHLPSSEVLCYLDHMAVHSQDAWSHLRVLRKVPTAFRAAGLQISPGKAQLFRDHIKYLGHEIRTRGISIPPEYTSVIKDWPIPDTLKTLRAFLGKCGYYRRFIEDYATISAPLIQYTQQENMKGSHISIKTPRPSEPSVS